MTELLASVTEVFTEVVSWAGTVGDTVADTPLLMLGVTLGFVGIGVGFFKRLLNI